MPVYSVDTFHVRAALNAIDRMEHGPDHKDVQDWIIGADSWDEVRDMLHDETIKLSVDTLAKAPYRVMLSRSGDMDASSLGWINVEPQDDRED